MPGQNLIYALLCPNCGCPRYVGKGTYKQAGGFVFRHLDDLTLEELEIALENLEYRMRDEVGWEDEAETRNSPVTVTPVKDEDIPRLRELEQQRLVLKILLTQLTVTSDDYDY